MYKILIKPYLLLLLAAPFVAVVKPVSAEQNIDELNKLVNQAHTSLQNFYSDPAMGWFRKHIKDAKGLFIIPQMVKAGLIFGGSGGSGILVARDDTTGSWSDPSFHTMGAVSFGLQFGVEAAEVMLMVMTNKGMNAMLLTKFQLGADVSVATGPVGAGAQAATIDILAFSRNKGLYGGLSIEGAVIQSRHNWNSIYYGQPVHPEDILLNRYVSNVNASALKRTLTKVTGGI